MTIAQTALERLYGGCDVITARNLGELRTELDRVQRPHVLLHSDTPDEGMAEMLLRSEAAYLIVTTDPANVVRDLMAERGLDVPQGIQAASLSFSCLHDISLKPRAIVIRRMGYEYNVEAIVREILRAVGRFPDAQQIDALLAGLFPDGQIDGVWSVTRILDTYFALRPADEMVRLLDRNGVSLVDDVLGDFAQLGSRPFNRTTWPTSFFLSGNNIGHRVDGPLSFTGPARILVYGPYVHLPRGNWVATSSMTVRDNRGTVGIHVDVFSGTVRFAQEFALPESAQVELTFPFSIEDALVPVEIRLMLRSGAIEGQLNFGFVEVERTDAA